MVLEAQECAGGRIREHHIHHERGDAVVEAGAEFIHGTDSELLSLLADSGIETTETTWPNYFYLNKESLFTKELELGVAERAFDRVREDARDESLLQYFVRCGVSSRLLDLVDAVYANDYGAPASELGAREVAHEQRRWCHGEAYLLADKPLRTCVDVLTTGLDVRYHQRVSSVRIEAGLARVNTDELHLKARAVVLAVPVASLVAMRLPRAIDDPPLVANALKAFVVLARPIWAGYDDFWNVVCADAVFPELWVSTRRDRYPVVVGFVMGARADRLAKLDRHVLRTFAVPHAVSHPRTGRRLLDQLDAIFGATSPSANENERRPATAACIGFDCVDWSSLDSARGGYTYPAPGARERATRLAAPIGGVIFFAGEATNTDLNPCLQGAMASGRRAAAEAIMHLHVARAKSTAPLDEQVIDAAAAVA